MAINPPATTLCPCNAGEYATCCGPYHTGAQAHDAKTLMRSRYSAYVLKNAHYLLNTWHSDTRPVAIEFAVDKWLGLEVKSHSIQDAEHASVEFIARYKVGGRAHRLHEISQFVRENGQWLYVDGNFPN